MALAFFGLCLLLLSLLVAFFLTLFFDCFLTFTFALFFVAARTIFFLLLINSIFFGALGLFQCNLGVADLLFAGLRRCDLAWRGGGRLRDGPWLGRLRLRGAWLRLWLSSTRCGDLGYGRPQLGLYAFR